ncbi:alpha/beta-hydrolase [Gloeopeniophorella convolvens]|nr:alpha/beta-hydrolase [Gloeopeniophorella convolvens]
MPNHCTQRRVGMFAIHDTGVPVGSNHDYKTLIIIHGSVWHAGAFGKFVPLAEKNNTRLVLIDRRDYPGSTPLTDKERAMLTAAAEAEPAPEATENIKEYMKERTKEIFDCLYDFVKEEDIPDKSLILVGASLGAAWLISLLANGRSLFGTDETLLRRVRRLVVYNPSYHALGYAAPASSYSPRDDPSLTQGEADMRFQEWVSGYYSHGDSPFKPEFRNPLADSLPTIANVSPDEISAAMHAPPASVGGSDALLVKAGIKHGLFAALRDVALYPKACTIELRFMWGDHAVWEVPFGIASVREELAEAHKAATRRIRNITYMRLEGANACTHWDDPERALKALLTDAPDANPLQA